MAIQQIPRNAAGAIALPGAYSRKWEADFTTLTALPSWLTSAASEGTVAITNGELVMTATRTVDGGANAFAYVAGPAIDVASATALRFSVFGSYIATATRTEMMQAWSTWADMTASVAGVRIGAQLHAASSLPSIPVLRHTQGDWPVSTIPQYRVDDNYGKDSARSDRTFTYIPSTKMAYAIEGREEVRIAREMTSFNATSVQPIWALRRLNTGTMDLRCRRIEIEVFYA